MVRKDYAPEQAIGMLREAEVRLSQGEKVGKIRRGLWISEQSHYPWRHLYGGLKVDQARRLLLARGAAHLNHLRSASCFQGGRV